MGELINGRPKKAVKQILFECYYDCDDVCHPNEPCDCPYSDDCNCGAVATVPKSLIYDILSYIEILEAQQPKWISVKERLPELPGTYGAYALGMHLVLEFDENEDWWDEEFNYYNASITHWMPLPEPPEEGE